MSLLIDVGLGLMVVFLIFSIIVSGINEWLAQAFARRGHFLRLGLQRLINDEAIYRRVLHHPLIESLYREQSAKAKPPSYIEPTNLALAIIEVIRARSTSGLPPAEETAPVGETASVEETTRLSPKDLRQALTAPILRDSPLAIALLPIIDRAGNDLEAAMKGIESWFTHGMDRVSGWYRARTQKVLLVIGLTLACMANVDTIEIFSALSRTPELRSALVTYAQSITTTGKVGNVDIRALGDRAPTLEEWRSLQSELVSMGNAQMRLPIGYTCLGTAVEIPQLLATSSPPKDKASSWEACKSEFAKTWETRSPLGWLLKVLGWSLTALAGTLGAGYWFALLSKGLNIRGSGGKPVTKTE